MEGLFSLFIVMMVMAGLAKTLGAAASVKKHTKDMDQAIEIYHALFTVRSDLVAALQISEPSPGGSSDTLRLKLVDPSLTYDYRTDVLSDPVNPFEDSEQIEVEYRLEDGLLKRTVTAPSKPNQTSRLIGAKTIRFERSGGSSPAIQIVLVTENQRVEKTRSLKVAVSSL